VQKEIDRFVVARNKVLGRLEEESEDGIRGGDGGGVVVVSSSSSSEGGSSGLERKGLGVGLGRWRRRSLGRCMSWTD